MGDIDRTINRILELIPEGRENAVSLAYLADLLQVNERTVKKYVSMIRIQGTPIIGDVCGYYKPADRSELQWYFHLFHKRGITSLRSISSARRDLQDVPGQLTLEELLEDLPADQGEGGSCQKDTTG